MFIGGPTVSRPDGGLSAGVRECAGECAPPDETTYRIRVRGGVGVQIGGVNATANGPLTAVRHQPCGL